MIVGLGTDIVNIDRFKTLVDRYGDRLAEKVLSGDELSHYRKSRDKAKFLSKRFAAKESVVKAMGTGFRDGISKRDIRIEHDSLGKPIVEMRGEAKRRIDYLGVKDIWVSISDDTNYAVATVILEK